MVLAKNSICDFGWKARDFALKGVDGKICTLGDVRGPKGTLIIFICNHCPYVKASIGRIVAEAKALREIGIGIIAIMPNDTATYREDSFDNMKVFAANTASPFPTSLMKRRRWRAPMAPSARPTSSASMGMTNCSIGDGSMRRARHWCPMPAATFSRR